MENGRIDSYFFSKIIGLAGTSTAQCIDLVYHWHDKNKAHP